MNQHISVRRGTNAARQTVTLDVGEPAYTTDTKVMYIGDGVTAGGIVVQGGTASIGGESFTSIIPADGSTWANNASGLYSAIISAKTKTPYGKPLSSRNRYAILLFPGVYDFDPHFALQAVINQTRYVDIIGVGNRDSIKLRNINNYAFSLASGYCNLENFTIYGGALSVGGTFSNINDVNIKNVSIYNPQVNGDGLVCDGAVNCTFDNLYVSGRFIPGDQAVYKGFAIRDSVVSNCEAVSLGYAFSSCQSSNNKNNTITNCKISDISTILGLFYQDALSNPYHYDNTNIFKNCYFSGQSMFNVDDAGEVHETCKAIFHDCTFMGRLAYFEGTMQNCLVDARQTASVYLSTAAMEVLLDDTYPKVYNSTVLAPSSVVAVTGESPHTGLFMHCRFNRPVASSVTGTMGNNLNSIHSSFK
jgi:hypothetical protein